MRELTDSACWANTGWMEGILRRLHVKPKVIHEAVTAVKLGLVSPSTLERVAKRASLLALAADAPLAPPPGEPADDSDGKQVWQPFPSADGDPATHALMWRKVPVTILPKLQPLPGTEKTHNFSAGEQFMQFDGGLYKVLNTTSSLSGEILPGAIELPMNGSGWKLQDISVLQGREPDATESQIDDKPEEPETAAAPVPLLHLYPRVFHYRLRC
jgi:hypothetical protein